VFGLAQCDREPERSTDVLAGVGNYDITTTEFTNTFNEAYFKTGQALVPDARTRRALLMNDLSGYILANRAKEQGLHQTEEGQRKLKRVRRRVINEEVRERFIVADVEVLEEDLNEAFLRFNTKIKASHLIASSKDEAVALKKRLAQGESFESLASEVFKNPTLASNGGDLGYFSIDEMDVGFEDVAYRLSVGEVSQQFARAKPQIYSYVKGKKEELLERAHLQSFLDSSEVAVNNVNELFEMQESQVNIGDLNWEDSTYLLRYKDFQFSMSDFANEYGLNPERESIFLSTKSAFNKLIKALAYRNYLYEMGLRNGLDNEPEITASIEETFAMELESLALKQIDESFTPSEDAIIDEYQRNRKQYIEPLKVKLRRLKVEDKNLANMLHKELENGASMVDLIAKHSSDPQDRLLKGVLGYKSINSFGTQAQQIARLEVGDISSVLEYSSNEYHIYECLGREESRQLSFVEAYSQVEERLRQKHRQRKQASLVEEALQSQHAFINEALLDTFEIEIYN
jgi:parvulin-like peptidyl-prolyl isomerase